MRVILIGQLACSPNHYWEYLNIIEVLHNCQPQKNQSADYSENPL